MSGFGKIWFILYDVILWIIAVGCMAGVILTLIGTIASIRDMIREKDELKWRVSRDEALIYSIFCLGMIFFTTTITLGALALTRYI